MSIPTFSIVLPIYNQSAHIDQLFDQYNQLLLQMEDSWELLFIVNGSKDDSFEKASRLAQSHPNVKAYDLKKGGWGRAVKFGLSEATGKFICYTNSARTSASDLILMLRYAKVNDHVVIKANRIIRELFIRRLGSVLYNLECRLLFRVPVWDVNGTPKVFPNAVIKQIEIHSDNDLIDAELMARCYNNNIPFIEVPITSTKRISGKSTTSLKSAFKMYLGLLLLKGKI
ncbi:MAG: glycosyltransferase family 2 protein [Bacteroidota bacterium]